MAVLSPGWLGSVEVRHTAMPASGITAPQGGGLQVLDQRTQSNYRHKAAGDGRECNMCGCERGLATRCDVTMQ